MQISLRFARILDRKFKYSTAEPVILKKMRGIDKSPKILYNIIIKSSLHISARNIISGKALSDNSGRKDEKWQRNFSPTA